MAKWIYSELPSGKIFVDAFGGSGSVLDFVAEKNPDLRLVYNDLDAKLFIFFTILRDRPYDLAHITNLTPYSRQIFDEAFDVLKDESRFDALSDIDKSLVFLIVNRQCFGSKMEPTWSITRDGEVNYETWGKLPSFILRVARRWKAVFLENLDYRELIPKWDSRDTVFYLDPPYEGVEDDYYDVNKKDGFDHQGMLEILRDIKGSFCVSYYGGETKTKDTDLIQAYRDVGCSVFRKPVKKHLSAEGEKKQATEVLLVKSNNGLMIEGRKRLRQVYDD